MDQGRHFLQLISLRKKLALLFFCISVMPLLFNNEAMATAPVNDDKANAIVLSNLTNWCSASGAYTNDDATGNFSSSCDVSLYNDVWFKFQATTTYIDIKVRDGTMDRSHLTLLNDQNVELGCSNAKMESLNLTVGEWYYINVSNTSSSSSRYEGTFDLCINDQAPSDYKEGAIVLNNKNNWCSSANSYTNDDATGNFSSSCDGSLYNDVWFKFQATTSYVNIKIHEGTMDNSHLTLLNDQNVEFSCGNSRVESLNLTVGEWYYINVSNRSSSSRYEGTFDLCINDQRPPDYKNDAIVLNNKNNWCSSANSYTNDDATGNFSSSCDGSLYNDVWFKFQAATSYIDIKVNEGTMDRSHLTLLNNQDSEIACGERIEALDLTIGEWYYINVSNTSSSSSYEGSFGLCVNDQVSFNYKEGAIVLDHKDNWCADPGTYTNDDATGNFSSSCASSSYNDVWFKFQATTTYMSIKWNEGSLRYPQMTLLNSQEAEIACSTRAKIEAFDLVIGEWYYLNISNGSSSSVHKGNFSLCINDQIPYDYKEGAALLEDKNYWFSGTNAYTNIGASGNFSNSCDGSLYSDVWFKFQAATSYIDIKLHDGTIDDPQLTLIDNQNIELICDNSRNHRIELFDLIVGDWYYINVSNNSYSSVYEGTFGLYVNDQMPYDYKSAAIIIEDKNHWTSNTNAFTNVDASGNFSSNCDGSLYSDVWFKFQADSPYINIQLLEETIKYSRLTLLNSQDTEVACASSEIELLDLTIGEWYYINVSNGYSSSSSNSEGTFGLHVNDQAPYDYKVGAILLENKDNWCSVSETYTNVNATGTFSSSCDGSLYNDVWFKFQATTPYIDIKLIHGGLRFPNIKLMDSQDNELACDDLNVELFDLVEGEWYYLNISSTSSHTMYNGTFGICVNDQAPYDYKIGAIKLDNTNQWCSVLGAYSTENTGRTAMGSSCNSGVYHDVWFEFEAKTQYIGIELSTLNTPYPRIEYPHLLVTDELGNEVVCNSSVDRGLENTLLLKTEALNLTIGEKYYISIGSTYSHISHRGTFTLCVNDQTPYDLQMLSIAPVDSIYVLGEELQTTFYLDDFPVSVEMDYYFSSNSTLDSSDTYLGRKILTDVQTTHDIFIGQIVNPGNYYLITILDPDNQVADVDKTNNTKAFPIIIDSPDYIFHDVKTGLKYFSGWKKYGYEENDTFMPGQEFDLVLDIHNQGMPSTVTHHKYAIWFSQDSVLSNDDIRMVEDSIGVGNQAEPQVTMPDVSDGTYYLIVVLDPNDDHPETNKTNNMAIKEVVVKSTVDFEVGVDVGSYSGDGIMVSFRSDSEGSPNAKVYARYRIYNNSGLIFDNLSLYGSFENTDSLSVSDFDEASDFDVHKWMGIIRPGINSKTISLSIANYPADQYYIVTLVDANDKVPEINESNNLIAAPVTLYYPDPYVYMVSPRFDPATNEELTFILHRQTDIGILPDDVDVDYYISTHSSFDNTAVLLQQTVSQSYADRVNIDIPDSYLNDERYYYLYAHIDPQNTLQESDESNNINSLGSIYVGRPDLEVAITSVPPKLNTGGQNTVRVRLSETKFQASEDVNVGYYLSIDNSINTTYDNIFSGNVILRSEASHDITFTLPANISAGNYQLLVRVDNDNNIDESNENNNVAGQMVSVESPDLMASLVSCPATLDNGKEQTFRVQLSESNARNVGNIDVGYYLSADNSIYTTADNIFLGSDTLLVGAAHNITFSVPENLRAGNYFLLVKVDDNNSIDEPDETNNIASCTVPISGYDLQVSLQEYPNGISMGQQTTVRILLSEANSQSLTNTKVSCTLSADPDLSTTGDNITLGNSILATGQSHDISFVPTSSTVSEGEYYLILKADSDEQVNESNENNNEIFCKLLIVDCSSPSGLADNDPADPDQAFLEKWSFQYAYDGRQRMVKKQVPGAGAVYMVYDDRDRLVLAQDANQRELNQWTFTKYDVLNRPVMTGIYTANSKKTQSQMQSDVDAFYDYVDANSLPGAWFETYNGAGIEGYTNASFPNTISTSDVLTVTYYDDYAFMSSWEAAFHYDPSQLSCKTTNDTYCYPVGNNTRVKQQVTGAMVKNLGTNEWIKTVNYYDDRYRLIQSVTKNHQSGFDRLSSLYDFVGKVIMTKETHDNGANAHQVAKAFDYDHAGRLKTVKHQLNSQPEVILVQNEYNELGELVDKQLYSDNNGAAFEQSVDYRYNIRGWLTHINKSDLSTLDNSDANDPADLFGMQLAYETGMNGINTDQSWNGNISATKWSQNLGMGEIKERAYRYTYDPMNRIKSALHHMPVSGNWTARNDFSVTGISYDLNGNISTLNRNSTSSAMDSLQYTYHGNRLEKVKDWGNIHDGFKEVDLACIDYDYDNNGNLVRDLNKGIKEITYNHLNLPVRVVMYGGQYLLYTYDAAGIKLAKAVYDADNILQKRTDYLGGFIYEDDVLQHIQHEEGRAVPTQGGAFEYQYYLKDHLGNTRITFTTADKTTVYQATMESEHAAFEEGLFDNIPASRAVYNNANHTIDTSINANEVARLNGAVLNRRIGPAKALLVMPGDAIDLEVFAYHTGSIQANSPVDPSLLVGALAAAFNGVPSGSMEQQAINDLFDQNGGALLASTGAAHAADIKAYLNYLLFNNQGELVDAGFQKAGAGSATGSHEQLKIDGIQVKEAGFIFVYLSNESDTYFDVYFDDLSITHKRGKVLQEDHYYPFGANISALSSTAPLSKPNQFKLSGNEEQTDFDLNLYDFNARFYDQALGRFINVDPMANERDWLTPYNYVQNNPLLRVDPAGTVDWVRNQENGEYEWMNEVTSESDTPEGYTYVGAEDSDVVKDIYGSTSGSSSDWDFGSIKTKRFNNPYSGKGYAVMSAKADTKVSVNLTADVETQYNGDGSVKSKEFKGVNVSAVVTGEIFGAGASKGSFSLRTESMQLNGNNMSGLDYSKGPILLPGPSELGGIPAKAFNGSIDANSINSSGSNSVNVSFKGLYMSGKNYLKQPTVIGESLGLTNYTNVSVLLRKNN